MVKRVATILLLALPIATHAAMTPAKRDMFAPASTNNVLAYNSGNKGTFDFAVDLPVIAIGARTNPMPVGWSGWVQRRSPQYVSWTNLASATYYQAGMWIRFHQLAVSGTDAPLGSGTANAGQIWELQSASHGAFRVSNVDGVGGLWVRDLGAASQIATLSVNTWYYMALGWNSYLSGTWKIDAQINLGTLGSPLTNIFSVTGASTSSQIKGFTFGNQIAIYWSGRITGCTLDTMAGFADMGIPSDMIAPPATRTDWYLSTTGSDSNAGISLNNAFGTGNMLANLLRYGGAMGSMTSWVYSVGGAPAPRTSTTETESDDFAWNSGVMSGAIIPNGDRILIDTSSGPLYTTNVFLFTTNSSGIEISAVSGKATIKPFKLLSSFTQYDSINYPNVYQTPDSEAFSVLWEDGKWMSNPTNGAGFDATTAASLQANPGSFYSTSTNLWFHPFGSTDPTSDGKVYERSQWTFQRDNFSRNHTLELQGLGNYVHDLILYGNTYRDQTNGAWHDNYDVRADNTGPFVMGNCHLLGGGKHTYGAVGGGTNLYRFLFNTSAGQGPAWAESYAITGYGHMVEFPNANQPATRRVYYVNCDWSTNSLIGSASGTDGVNPLTGLSGDLQLHTSGSSQTNAYQYVAMIGCKGGIAAGVPMIYDGGFLISNHWSGPFSRMLIGTNTNSWVWNSRVDGYFTTGAGVNMRNSIINRNDDIGVSYSSLGNINLLNCVVDGLNAQGVSLNNIALLSAGGAGTQFGVTNCLFRLPANASFSAAAIKFLAGNTWTGDHNVYVPCIVGGYLMNSNSAMITWSTWVASGHDANGRTNTSLCIDTKYHPYAKTPAWTTGLDIGAALDYTSKLYQSRRTAGAYEYHADEMMLISR